MSYSYSLLERLLVYGPQFTAAVSAVLVLVFSAFPGRITGILRDKTYKIAISLIFLFCVLLFLFVRKPYDAVNGIQIYAVRAFLLAAGACLFVLLKIPDDSGPGPYVLSLAAFGSMHAAFTAENAGLILAAFIAMDAAVFAVIYLKKDSREYAAGLLPAKMLYAVAVVVFASLFIFAAGKTAKMAQAGCAIFMILFSTPGLMVMRGNDGEAGEKFLNKNSFFIMFSGIITAVIAAIFLSYAGQQAAARPVVIACVLLGCVNIYRTITEEKYVAYSGHDSINPVFLLPALACGTVLPGNELETVSLLFVLSVLLHGEFIDSHDHGKHSVASMKYGFDRVKGGWTAFLGIISGLAAEICVFILFYRYMKQDPLIFASVIFMALAFSVSMLNKFFMILSMLKRFKINTGKITLAAKSDFRPALYVLFTAALLIRWWR